MIKAFFLHLEEVVGCVFMVVFVALAFLNVILRYLFGYIMSWAEEAILILFVWSVFLGTATAFRYDRHIAIDVLFNLFPKKMQKALHYFIDILVLVLCLYTTYLSIVLCANVGVKSTFVLRVPFYYIYLMLVVSFGLMSLFAMRQLYLRCIGRFTDLDDAEKVMQSVESEEQ